MIKWLRIALVIWTLTAIKMAHADFVFFSDPRFATDPFQPFYNYGTDEKDDEKEDLEVIAKRFGSLTKNQVNPEVQGLIDGVYKGLKSQYPLFMENKAKPTFAIVENKDFSALSAYSSRLVKPHGILVVPIGFVVAKKSRCAKMGLVAHEMSHLFLHHNDISVHSPVIQVQYADGKAMSENESQAAARYLQLARHIGELAIGEANGMQLSSRAWSGFEDFISSLFVEKSKDCGSTLKENLRGLAKNIRAGYSEFRGDLRFDTSESLAALNSNTSQMIQFIERCVRQLGSGKNAIQLGISQKEILTRVGIRHPSLDHNAKAPTFSEYIELNKQVVNKMKVLALQFQLSQLRTVTTEDQADQMAVGLLVRQNCSPSDYIELFMDEIPKAKKQCEAQIKTGKEPPFGDLSDPHHSFCWRFDHFSKYAKRKEPIVEGLTASSLKPDKTNPVQDVKADGIRE